MDSPDVVVDVNSIPKLPPIRPDGLSDTDVINLRAIHGWNEVSEKEETAWKKIIRRYLALVPTILFIAAMLSVFVVDSNGSRDWLSFSLLMFLINLTVWADYFGERSAKSAITALESLASPTAYCKRKGVYQDIPARELLPGDIVSLRAGVILPGDGYMFVPSSSLQVDESALTGESLPASKYMGDELLSGSIVQRGETEIVITFTGKDSFFGKTIALLGKAETRGHLRLILDKAAKIITLIAAAFALFLFLWLLFRTTQTQGRISPNNRGLFAIKSAFVLIASVTPAAMPVVTTTVLAVGSVIMSKEKAIVNRLSAIEEAAGIEVLCSDKTGTLTKNELSLFTNETYCAEGVSQEKLLLMASLAGTLEHPEAIDKVIHAHADLEERKKYEIVSYSAFNPVDKRTEARVYYSGETTLTVVTKGAPHIIRDLVCVNNPAQKVCLDEIITSRAARGLRTVGVACRKETSMDWFLLGYLCIFDPPRDDTKATLSKALRLGIDVKMITGDQQAIAIETARQLGVGTNIMGPEIWSMPGIHMGTTEGSIITRDALATGQLTSKIATGGAFLGHNSFAEFVLSSNGFAGMYPEHKFNVVNAILSTGRLVGMTGDGVNDAPALKLATVGIAVAGATEAAKSAADIVLLKPGLSGIIKVFSLSRKIFRRIESYIIYRIYTSLFILIFIWSATVFLEFSFPSWTLVLISLINDFTLMSCAADRVPTSKVPLRWSMAKVAFISGWMASVSATLTVAYVLLADPAFNINWWTLWNLSPFVADISSATAVNRLSSQTNAGVWLLMTLLIQLSFHSCRTKGFFFRYTTENRFPSFIVLIPQVLSVTLTLFLSIYWQTHWQLGPGNPMTGIGGIYALLTTGLAVLFFFLVDMSKVLIYRISDLHWNELSLFNLFLHEESGTKAQQIRMQNLRKLVNEELDKRLKNKQGRHSIGDKLADQTRTLSRERSLRHAPYSGVLPLDHTDHLLRSSISFSVDRSPSMPPFSHLPLPGGMTREAGITLASRPLPLPLLISRDTAVTTGLQERLERLETLYTNLLLYVEGWHGRVPSLSSPLKEE